MPSPAETYRSFMLAERAAAESERLPLRRAQHEQSAAAWEKMAQQAEGFATRAAENRALGTAHPVIKKRNQILK